MPPAPTSTVVAALTAHMVNATAIDERTVLALLEARERRSVAHCMGHCLSHCLRHR